MNKNAQISMSFNWIFILIAGIVFLIFFFSVIGNQTSNSEKKVAAVVAKQFQTILETTSQKAGTFKTYRTSPIDLYFTCDGKKAISNYKVGETYAGTTTYDVIFSPPHLYGRELYTWTQDWEYPFRVTNFLYVTNKYHMFIFFKKENTEKSNTMSGSRMNKLEKNFPANLTISYLNEDNIPTVLSNNDRYTYIIFSSQLSSSDSSSFNDFLSDEKVIKENSQLIIINPDSSDFFKSGTIYFKKLDELRDGETISSYLNFDNSTYYGAASLYGAIFSGEKQSYECNMQKAFNKLNMINKLNNYRINSFLPEISVTSNCFYLYNGSINLGGGMKNYIIDYIDDTNNGFYGADKNKILTLVDNIERKNSRISFEARCPLLY